MSRSSQFMNQAGADVRARYRRGGLWRVLDGLANGTAVALSFAALTHGAASGYDTWLIAGLAAASAALCALRAVAGRRALSHCYAATFDAGLTLRRDLLRRLAALPFSAYRAFHPGKVAQTLSEDVTWIENYAAVARVSTRAELATILLLLVCVAAFSWQAALAALAMWAAAALAIWVLSRRVARGLRLRSHGLAEAGKHFMEYAEGVDVVRAFGAPALAERDFTKWAEIARQGFRKAIYRNTPLAALGQGLATLAVGAGAIAAALTAPQDAALWPTIAALGLLAATLVPARTIVTNSVMKQIADIGEENIAAIKAAPPATEGDQIAAPGPARIDFKDVSFAYGAGAKALTRVSFSAAPGTVTAIVGPSGAGKSTLAHLILRFWTQTEGSIALNGQDIADYTMESYMARFSAVFQETHLFRDTVLNNIRIGRPDASEAELVAAAKYAQIHDRIMRLPEGYQTPIGPGGARLSGGERQRITIARAILKDADVVILDEATAALDPENERDIQIAFEALARGKTVFIIAHRLSTIIGADQILLMDGGRLVACGRHDDLLNTAPLYQTLWDRHQTMAQWSL